MICLMTKICTGISQMLTDGGGGGPTKTNPAPLQEVKTAIEDLGILSQAIPDPNMKLTHRPTHAREIHAGEATEVCKAKGLKECRLVGSYAVWLFKNRRSGGT
jgi:hypothetical protein